MKTLRRLCVILVLTFTLAFSTYAGHIPCGVTDNPPSPVSQATTTGEIATGLTGEMPTGLTGQMTTGAMTTDLVTETLLSLLQSLLALF